MQDTELMGLSKDQSRVFELLDDWYYQTVKELCPSLGMRKFKVRRLLNEMQALGKVEVKKVSTKLGGYLFRKIIDKPLTDEDLLKIDLMKYDSRSRRIDFFYVDRSWDKYTWD